MLGGSLVIKHFSDAALLGIHKPKDSIEVSVRPVTITLFPKVPRGPIVCDLHSKQRTF